MPYSYLGLSFDNPTIQNQVQVLASACEQDKMQQTTLKEIQTLKTDGKYKEAIAKAKTFSDAQSR
ncbi:MAG: hypothetical protein HC866_26370 [Leptolyngbyaceae cyanobacterium RU_5_1]|nr:hypothetical protein [Leptolyngbyaceae cyanobacterium RU_5_1]